MELGGILLQRVNKPGRRFDAQQQGVTVKRWPIDDVTAGGEIDERFLPVMQAKPTDA